MGSIFEYVIKVPIGYILGWIYNIIPNYGWALIIFTVVIKLILLPLGLKQQKSMTKMQKLQPKLAVVQEKYKNDQNKLSQETMKIYKEHHVSPTGGCLPLIVQLPILFGLYRVLYRPITYMLHWADKDVGNIANQLGVSLAKSNTMAQIEVAEKANLINFDFLGLNLADNPKLVSVAIIIPILAGITTYFASKITQLITKTETKKETADDKPKRILSPEQKDTGKQATSAESMTKSMTVVMPLFTMWITYKLPMALGVYWIASNLFSIGQTVLLNGHYSQKLNDEINETLEEKSAENAAKYGHRKKRKGN